MTMRKLLSIIICIAALCGCSSSESKTNEIVSADGKFSAVLPSNMHEIKGMNDFAKLQYGCMENGISFMVVPDNIDNYKQMIDKNIDEFGVLSLFDKSKNEDIYGIAGYVFLVTQNLMMKSESAKIDFATAKDTVINGMSAQWLNYTMREEGEISYVELCVFKGKENFYQVYSMCSQRKKADNLQAMRAMISSFKEK